MTQIEYMKYGQIKNEILEELKDSRQNNLIFDVNFSLLSECLQSAKRKVKLNNSLLKEGYNDNIMVFDCLDENLNELVKLSLKPNVNNTVKQLFTYEILKSQFATKQEFEKYKN